MTTDTYLTIDEQAEGLYKDKGSKFISMVFHVESIEEANIYIEEVRKQYHDARHVCYAYMIGWKREIFRANDDGEPSGTAGRPILGQINSANLTNVLVVVVRYFGGILLGTGGLIVAYKTAAAEAISNATITEKIVEERLTLTYDYAAMNQVMRIVKECNLNIIKHIQEMNCTLIVSCRLSMLDNVITRIEQLRTIKIARE